MTGCKHRTINGIFTAALLLSLLLSGCNSSETVSEVSKYSEIEETSSIDEATVEDNSQLYENDDPYSVTAMYLTVRKGNEGDNTNHTWSEVNTYSTYYYDENNLDRYKVEATLQVGDETGPLPGELGYGVTVPNAVVQVRGKTSSKPEQKSYQIKIKSGKGNWNDQKTIILNKHVYDATRFRNKLTYDLMSNYSSLISARTEFVHLYVRDLSEGSTGSFVDYGLYTQVEQINGRYLSNHGLDENGQLYKASMFEFKTYDDTLKLTTDSSYDKDAFEDILEIKGDDDHSKLIAMLKDLNDYSIPIETIMDEYFDEENYFTWLAFQTLIGNKDITSQNFFLYSPLNGTKWYFIPWDHDGAWNYLERIETTGGGYNYEEGVSNYWGSVLHQRVLKSAALRAKLTEKIEYFHNELTTGKLQELVSKYSAVVEPYLYSMPDVEHAEKTESEYQAIVESMVNEIEYNYQMYYESLKHPMPFYSNTPVVSGDKINFTWDNSFDFNNETLKYTFELSTDYNFNTVIYKQTDIFVPSIQYTMLPDGQYFYRLTVTNTSGETQTALYYYEDINDIKHYGVTTFYVEGGAILTESTDE